MNDLFERIPPLRRARDYHLYDRRGGRILDLWLNGGRALLGHRPEGLQREMKEVLAKGILSELPSVYEARLRGALLRLIPGDWRVALFRSKPEAERAAADQLGLPESRFKVEDPFLAPPAPGRAAYYRPFLEADYSEVGALFPILPFPIESSPWPVLFRFPLKKELPEEACCSPLLLAGMLKTLHDLLKVKESPDIWKDWDLPGWRRSRCYCGIESVRSGYDETFDRFLKAGVLLPPDRESPIILPRSFSPGERKLVEKLCGETA